MPNIEWKDGIVKQIHDTKEVKKLLSSQGPSMVIIYADWCTHCQRSEPEWNKLSKLVDGKATIYAIESNDYKGDDISGYPTIKIVKNGKSVSYNGDRSAESMKDALLSSSLSGGKRSRRNRTGRLRNRRRKTHRTSS